MPKHRISIVLLVSLILAACGSKKDVIQTTEIIEAIPTEEISLEEIVITPEPDEYRATETRVHDLIHTNLAVSFDWEQRSVMGKAELQLTPYFYKTDSLQLDAKGMQIESVKVINGNNRNDLVFLYDSLFLNISLDKSYERSDTFEIEIVYEAFPERFVSKGSNAITSAQGIYFINPDSTEVNKPTQIWTQGETEANSVWFPTIDSPNERMTQEIQITVDEKYKTLSNGSLIFSNYNGDGTRTDYWKQEMPHAPYLVMLAVGDYNVTTESWVNAENEDIVVDYYLEDEYAPYAKDIFGNTPEMLTFYSEVLGFPYPWEKYSQVVVRDFVSGAMENTTAVIHGDFLHATKRELLDGDNEAVIAHELFHHWFGDLVTCESWSNLPLNESFAMYGEYLWMEHKYGREQADLHSMNSMAGYLAESQQKQVDLIRFYYEDKEDMFDGHSYNKGGRVLHMLRYFLGDEAFFSGLNLYLNENKYEAVEIHQLRLAMEEVSGKDLNWFFNQWFLGKGHPDLDINYEVNDSLNQVTVLIEQNQDKLFRLPLMVDVFTSEGETRRRIDIRKKRQEFVFDYSGGLLLVNVDAEKVLLGTKNDNRPEKWWSQAYTKGKLFLDKYEALSECSKSKSEACQALIYDALDDPFWKIREQAVKAAKKLKDSYPDLKEKLTALATEDPKSAVRARAIKTMAKTFKEEDLSAFYKNGLNDQSYRVMAESLDAIAKTNTEMALAEAKNLEDETGGAMVNGLTSLYAKHGNESHVSYMKNALEKSSGFSKYGMASSYAGFLNRLSPEVIEENISPLVSIAENEKTWWVRLAGYTGLKGVAKELAAKTEDTKAQAVSESINNTIETLLATETEDQIKAIMAR